MIYYHETLRGFWIMLQGIDIAKRLGVHSNELFPIIGRDGKLKYWWHRELGRIEP